MLNRAAKSATESPPPGEDGRRLRSADSRRRIVAAVLALIQQGMPNPSAEDVAIRAGVGLRTVFRLFKDMESLAAEMLVPLRQEFVDMFNLPYHAPRGPARIMELYERLAKLFERRMPLRRAGIIRQYESPSLRAGMRELDETIVVVIRHNAPDSVTADASKLEMLSLLTSYDAWMRLRDAQGLSFEQAYVLLSSSIAQLIGAESSH